MIRLLDKVSILVFCLCLPPGTFLFIYMSHSNAFAVSKVLAAVLGLYWLLRFSYSKVDIKELKLYVVVIAIAFCYFFVAIIHAEYTSGLIGGFRVITLVLFAVFCFTCFKKYKFVDLYIGFAVASSILVIIGFLISQFYPEGVSQYLNPDERVAYNYIFSTSNALYQFGEINFPRMAFYFDEPGTYALIIGCAYILLDMGNGKLYQKLILITSGFLTMSMAFFFLLGLLLFTKVNIRNIKSTIVFWCCFLLLVSIIVQSPLGQVIDSLFLGRLESIISGGAGNTRTAVTENAIKYFSLNPWYGVGFNSNGEYEFFGANIFYFLAMGGILFVPLYFPLLYLTVRYMKSKFPLYLLPILLLFFQRPDYLLPYGFLSFLVLFIYPVAHTEKVKI